MMRAYILERLNDFVHVNELAIVGLEWKININASDLVRWHLFRLPLHLIENAGKFFREIQNVCSSKSI